MANLNISDDLLRCPISMELFRDPVLAPDGHTYEREDIEQWIRRNGTSPITREPFSIDQLYPNRMVKELVDVFEASLRQRNYQFTLDIDVKKKKGRPLFQTFGKTIYNAEWLLDRVNRPEIIILKIDSARAKKEASFYVDLSRHPHIIRTFGFVYDRKNPDQQENAILLLQEYAREGSLYELLQEKDSIPDEKILIQIFLQIIEAMICLASNHVVHGDLACRNVLVFRFDENQPEKNVVKITDFGLSRQSQLYAITSGAAMTTLNIVPVRYTAPEVFVSDASSEAYTEKSDVFSMGVLMWEAYSGGSLPWGNISNDNDVIRRVRNGNLLSQPSNCSEPFWSVITKTWSRSPNDRPTFSELKHLLTAQYYQSGCLSQSIDERCVRNTKYVVDHETTRNNIPHGLEEQHKKTAEQCSLLKQVKQEERPITISQADEQLTNFQCRIKQGENVVQLKRYYSVICLAIIFILIIILSLVIVIKLMFNNETSNLRPNISLKQRAIVIVGMAGRGNQSNQLNLPVGISIDKDQTLYIADYFNHRIVEWKSNAKNGQIVAGGNSDGNQMNQLNYPTVVIIDERENALIICDSRNRRVMRWSRYNNINGEIIIPNIACFGLAMDKKGRLYVSDYEKHEVRRWRRGDTNGTIVAGGHGIGNGNKHLNYPNFIFIDDNYSLYISDEYNHRVMKWSENATEGVVVAGGNNAGNKLTQLYSPHGVIVNQFKQIYVADYDNNRIMRWNEGAKEGMVVVGDEDQQQSTKISSPAGLSLDRQRNLYVVSHIHNQIYKIDINKN